MEKLEEIKKYNANKNMIQEIRIIMVRISNIRFLKIMQLYDLEYSKFLAHPFSFSYFIFIYIA